MTAKCNATVQLGLAAELWLAVADPAEIDSAVLVRAIADNPL
jgi:hypothetical protein